MKTKQFNVRLSKTAWNNLEAICQSSGINQTAAVEIALTALKTGLTKGTKMDTIFVIVSDRYGNGEGTIEEINNSIQEIDFDLVYETTVRGVQVLRNDTGIVAVEKGHENAAW
jgi:hypothetical protein